MVVPVDVLEGGEGGVVEMMTIIEIPQSRSSEIPTLGLFGFRLVVSARALS